MMIANGCGSAEQLHALFRTMTNYLVPWSISVPQTNAEENE